MFHLGSLRRIISTLFVLCGAAVMAEGECPAQCSCAPSPPLCPAGVSWVTDRCGCCKVCARQFNQDCGASEPCDHIKGLRCHLGAGGDPERGLCRAEAQGLPCELNGRVYQHGEDFQPSCQHQCSCMDGVVGCMPLCPHQVPLPDWRCSRPRLATPSGGCCQEWLCDDDNRISEEPEEPEHTSLPDAHQPLPNHISTQIQAQTHYPAGAGGGTFREVVSLPRSEVLSLPGLEVVSLPRSEALSLPGSEVVSLPRSEVLSLPGSEVLSLPGSEVLSLPRLEVVSCFPQTTDWTDCTTTCGMGISSRVTNSNPECRLVRETRLCQIRQCDTQLPTAGKKAKKCQRTVRPQEPIRITFAGCSTAQRYRPRTCGICTDNRCYAPSLSRTVRLRFHCPDGEGFYRNVMWIQRCGSRESCPGGAGPSRPSISLHNDIHTFRH